MKPADNCVVDRARARSRMTPVRRSEIYYPGDARPASSRPKKVWPVLQTPRDRARSIVRQVADKHGFAAHELYGPRGPLPLVEAKFEAMYRLRAEAGFSLPQIASHFQLKDHTSALYGVRQHCRRNGLEAPR